MSEELNVIFHACKHGRTDIVQKAIQSIRGDSTNPQVNDSIAQLVSTGRAEDGQTPLHVAAAHGHSDVIRALLSAGAHLAMKGTYGEALGLFPYEMVSTEAAKSAFHIYLFEAIALNNVEMVQNLLKGGVPPTVSDGSSKMDSALHWAASSGEKEIMKLLVSYGANLNFMNSLGQTPLHSACASNNSDSVYFLLEAGADKNICDEEGRTPFHLVTFKKQKGDSEPKKIVDMLENPPSVRKVLGPRSGRMGASMDAAEGDSILGGDEVSSAQASVKPSSASYPNPNSSGGGVGGGNFNRELAASIDSAMGGDLIRDSASVMSGGMRSRLNSQDTKAGFDDEEDAADGCQMMPMDPILVLWPPPQRMNRRNHYPFILSNDAIITLSASSSELESVSFLIESLARFQFKVEISPPLVGAIIKMHVDENICTKRNSYEVIVDPGQVQIIGADSVGMRYGVQTFVQLMQLHSDLTVLESSDIAIMKLPSVHISDWPDIDHRAILWSHRSIAVHNQDTLTDMVGLLSKIRINTIHLTIDSSTDSQEIIDDDFNIVSGNVSIADWGDEGGFSGVAAAASVDEDEDSSEAEAAISSSIADLSETCVRSQIKLVPSLTFSSLEQRVPCKRLRKFEGDSIVMTLDYEQQQVAQELIAAMKKKEAEIIQRSQQPPAAGGGPDGGIIDGAGAGDDEATRVVTKTDVENAIKQRCVDIMSSVKECGFSTITLVCNEWIKRVVNPLEVVFRFGLSGVERSASVMCPARYACKQIICVNEFIRNMHFATAKARDAGSSTLVFPAFLDNDVMMPLLLSKYHSFLFSGFAWNSHSVVDMLGDMHSPDASVLREVSYLLIFQSQPDITLPEYRAVLGLFTGELFAGSDREDDPARQLSPASAGNTQESRVVAKAELVLYALLHSRENVGNFHALDQADAVLCAKYYKRMLSMSQWRLGKTKSSLEMEEFFTLLNLVHGLAKAMVYSYAGKEKIMRSLHPEFSRAGPQAAAKASPAYSTPHSSPSKASTTAESPMVDGDNSPRVGGNAAGNGGSAAGLEATVTYSTLLSWVAPGTNSDTANLLLEALEHLSVLWQRRYRTVWFHEPGFYANLSRKRVVYVSTNDKHTSASLIKPVIAPDPHMKHDGQDSMLAPLKIRQNFYRREREGVPTTAIFNAGIMARLPQPRVVEQTFLRLFGGTE